jgi:hypothetical protein
MEILKKINVFIICQDMNIRNISNTHRIPGVQKDTGTYQNKTELSQICKDMSILAS